MLQYESCACFMNKSFFVGEVSIDTSDTSFSNPMLSFLIASLAQIYLSTMFCIASTIRNWWSSSRGVFSSPVGGVRECVCAAHCLIPIL